MRIFSTLALLFSLFACREESPLCEKPCQAMIFSDALPIQVWQADCQSFNEKDHDGFFKNCFFAPVRCNKDLKFSFKDAELGEYELVAFDGNDEIARIPFDVVGSDPLPMLQFSNTEFEGSIFPWQGLAGSNRSSEQNWLWDYSGGENVASANSVSPGPSKTSTRYLAIARPGGSNWPAGSYNVYIKMRNSSTYGGSGGDGLGFSVWGMPDAFSQNSITVTGGPTSLVRDNGWHEYAIDFTLDQDYQYISFAFNRQGGGGTFAIKADIDSTHINSAPTLYGSYRYTAIFNASEIDPTLCGKRIRFEVQEPSASPSLVGYTDEVDLIADGGEFIDIDYSNPIDYNALPYSDINDIYTKTIPAHFSVDRQTAEIEAIELSAGTVVTSSVMKSQNYLETYYLPGYEHKKILSILLHKNVEIFDRKWTLEEDYTRAQADRRSLLWKGTAWITERDTLVRNV